MSDSGREWGANSEFGIASRNASSRQMILAEEVRRLVFELLDYEPEYTGIQAGHVARQVEVSFLEAISK